MNREENLHADGSLGSALGNNTYKGGREPRLNRGRSWTIIQLQQSPKLSWWVLWSWDGPSEMCQIEEASFVPSFLLVVGCMLPLGEVAPFGWRQILGGINWKQSAGNTLRSWENGCLHVEGILNDASHFLDVTLYGVCIWLLMKVHPIGERSSRSNFLFLRKHKK